MIRRAPCPVLTVQKDSSERAQSGEPPFRRIVCGVDFSESSLRALEYAFSLAREDDATIALVHVVESLPETGPLPPGFDLEGYRVIVETRRDDREPLAEATVRVQVKGISEHTAATGNGPVNALDHALRKALGEFYPSLQEMHLVDYKVRILDETSGTAAKTRVLITSADGEETWGTVGVAWNIIDASWQALVDSVEYKLRRDERRTLG